MRIEHFQLLKVSKWELFSADNERSMMASVPGQFICIGSLAPRFSSCGQIIPLSGCGKVKRGTV